MSSSHPQNRLKHLRSAYLERDENERAAQADREPEISFEPTYFVGASALGAWPGLDFFDAQSRVRGELGSPHLPFLPELKERGFAATTLARTIASLDGLSADGASFGWRLTQGRAKEGQLAHASYASDINALADVVGRESSSGQDFKIQLLGPVSLAAQLYLHNGERALLDYGARRDLRDSLLAGLEPWVKLLREALPGERLVLQLNEPDLEGAMAGTIPTASGYRSLRALALHEVGETFQIFTEGARKYVDRIVLVEQPADLNPSLTRFFDALTYKTAGQDAHFWEKIAADVEAGRGVWLQTIDPLRRRPVAELAREILSFWRTVGLPVSQLPALTLVDLPGMDQQTPGLATAVLEHSTEVARAVSELASEV